MKQILSTKQLTEQEMIHAQSLSLKVKSVDVIRTQVIPFTIPDSASFDSVVFTSANALKYFLSDEQSYVLLKHKTIFSISGKTKQKLASQGFQTAETADSSQQLAEVITQSTVKSLLHPCSRITLNDLEIGLSQSAIKYIPIPVYDTHSIDVKIETENFDAVLFFSPSGVDSFLRNNSIPFKTICCCIGETTASYLQAKQLSNLVIYPQSPSAVAMLSLVASQKNFKQKHE